MLFEAHLRWVGAVFIDGWYQSGVGLQSLPNGLKVLF